MTINIDRALLEKLIGEYFDIGWREGFENRHHDDEQGSAQKKLNEIRAALAKQKEPIGTLTIIHHKGREDFEVNYYGSLPAGYYDLYTAPQSSQPANLCGHCGRRTIEEPWRVRASGSTYATGTQHTLTSAKLIPKALAWPLENGSAQSRRTRNEYYSS